MLRLRQTRPRILLEDLAELPAQHSANEEQKGQPIGLRDLRIADRLHHPPTLSLQRPQEGEETCEAGQNQVRDECGAGGLSAGDTRIPHRVADEEGGRGWRGGDLEVDPSVWDSGGVPDLGVGGCPDGQEDLHP